MSCRHWLAALLWLLPGLLLAQGQTYRVDLIVFLDRQGAGEAAPRLPLPTGIDPSDEPALRAARIRVLPDEAFGLTTEWNRLRNAQRYQPIARIAWEQVNPPESRGPRLALRAGQSLEVLAPGGFTTETVRSLEGSVALYVGRFLHLDIDLGYHEPEGFEGLRQHRLTERRRLRRDELHYFDHPRFGVLARVTRVDGG